MKRRSRVVLSSLSLGLLLFISGAIIGGCTSSTLPPQLTAEELARVKATHFKFSVGVEPHRFPVYSERLIEALRKTELFDDVDTIERVPDSGLIARVEREVYGKAAVPLATILTLGIVPSTVEETHGHVFSLRSPKNKDKPINVDFTYKGPTTLGWQAAWLNLSPDRTKGDSRQSDRHYAALALAIVQKAPEIQATGEK